MELIKKWWGSKNVTPFDISSAMQIECDSDAAGSVERACDTATNVSEKLGDLVALLHAKGLLTDDDILSLLSGFEKKV